MAWLGRFTNVFCRGRLHSDVDRELAFHLAERIDDLRAAGLTETEARRAAREKFGNLTLQIAVRHFRLALRSLAKTPGFTATVGVTLALGIGANSAVYSALDAVILRPLPYPESDHLVTLQQRATKGTRFPSDR